MGLVIGNRAGAGIGGTKSSLILRSMNQAVPPSRANFGMDSSAGWNSLRTPIESPDSQPRESAHLNSLHPFPSRVQLQKSGLSALRIGQLRS
jgi:hypothetical protein